MFILVYWLCLVVCPSVLCHCWLGHQTRKNFRLRNDLYCVEWDLKPYYTIPIYLAAYAYAVCTV